MLFNELNKNQNIYFNGVEIGKIIWIDNMDKLIIFDSRKHIKCMSHGDLLYSAKNLSKIMCNSNIHRH